MERSGFHKNNSHRSIHRAMPSILWKMPWKSITALATDDDLKAIYTYIPGSSRVSAVKP